MWCMPIESDPHATTQSALAVVAAAWILTDPLASLNRSWKSADREKQDGRIGVWAPGSGLSPCSATGMLIRDMRSSTCAAHFPSAGWH